MAFTKLSAEEVERRRLLSCDAWTELQKDDFQRWYQEECDKFYWKHGRCCAGCDHWSSEQGWSGECGAAPPVSGDQVMRSLGFEWSSYTPAPGNPWTSRDHVCGAFRDDFDWASLDADYLARIGAS